MKIPSRTQIGGHGISVRFDKSDPLRRDRQLWGLYQPYRQEILISKECPPSQRDETYVHELIEAANSIYSLEIPHPTITTLAVALHQALTGGRGTVK